MSFYNTNGLSASTGVGFSDSILLQRVCAPRGCEQTASPLIRMNFPEIDSLKEVEAELLRAGPKDHIIFDIDGTLIEGFNTGLFITYDPSAVPEVDRVFMETIKKDIAEYARRVGPDRKRDLFNSFLMLKTKKERIENVVPELFEKLRARGIRFSGLTTCPAGAFGSVDCGRTLRHACLQGLEIDFTHNFADEEFSLNTLESYNGAPSMFYQGVLYTNWKNKKGPALGAFYDNIGWVPEKVHMIDDLPEHLDSVKAEMEKRGIAFCGHQYRGARAHPLPPFRREIAEKQFEYLIQHDQLLTEMEAEQLSCL